jgi:hypothetical protein
MQFRTPVPVICLLLAAGSVFAQPAQAPLTSVAMFRVQPDKMERFVEMVQLVTPALEKLRQSGAVLGYGLDADVLHQPGPNVAFWVTVRDFAGLAQSDKAVQGALQANAEKLKDFYVVTGFDDHRDILVRSLERGPGKVPEGVLPITFFQQEKVKPGKMPVARMMFQHHEKPVLDRLIKEGVIYDYAVDVEAVHTAEPGTVWYLLIAPDMGAMDKVRAAFQESMQKLSAGEREAIEQMEEEVFDRKAHRDSISRALIFKSR